MRHWTSGSGLLKRTLQITLWLATLFIIVFGVWAYKLDRNIKKRFAEKRFAPPVEFYSAPEVVKPGYIFPSDHFENLFARKNYRKREFGQPIQPGDYSIWTGAECRAIVAFPPSTPEENTDSSFQEESKAESLFSRIFSTGQSAAATEEPAPTLEEDLAKCIAFRSSKRVHSPGPDGENDSVQIIAQTPSGKVLSVYSGGQPRATPSVFIEPELFAQYYGENPVLRQVVSLGQTPTLCLNALLAVEDKKFLEHPGVSFTGLARAFITNLRAGRTAQGGSTITQQLVKNYFLTDERTLKRKMTEIIMAFLVERHASKDEILETYINLIYMGQNGSFQVRGFAAASEHYFGKQLSDLNLEQCALIAGVLNSPGLFNPFKHPERALKRRAKVLEEMRQSNMIDEEEHQSALASPLPTRPHRSLTEPAPYFVQAVRRALSEQGFDESEGLRVYTTLNLRAQEAAQKAVRAGLERIETRYPYIKELKEKGKNLEAVLIAADPATGAIQALVGGRGYLATQFNRAIDSSRQVGSVMKPFVYLTALESLTEDGTPYTPVTPLSDRATTHKYEGQSWTPRNYDGRYLGEVPLFFSLKESLNASTVNLGLSVGLENIVDVTRRLGVKSTIKPLPSLTLGAYELTPMEVLQAYGTLANLGMRAPVSFISWVENLAGEELYRLQPQSQQVVSQEVASELVGIMKQVLLTGTGRGARLSGFTHPAAGKTGTTNDLKDAWFAGFTPYQTSVVWVGYDDNTPHKLTGSSGAVPIWTNYMKSYGATLPPDDFKWPDSVERAVLSTELQLSLGVPEKRGAPPEPAELIFKRGQTPNGAERLEAPFESAF